MDDSNQRSASQVITDRGGGGGGNVEGRQRQKAATRKAVRQALRALTEEDMRAESASITAHILDAVRVFRGPTDASATSAGDKTAAETVRLGLYVHCARLREVDTTPLLRAALAVSHVQVTLHTLNPKRSRTPNSSQYAV